MLAGLLLAAAAAPQGAVASSEAHATAAGAEVLAAGGNAVDAAVATGFALAVTYPVAGNLGGGGFLLHRTASGEAFFLDFRELVEAWRGPFAAALEGLAAALGLRDFSLHAELRVRPDGAILPIELNPLRFGGFCTTAELSAHAWGFDPYAAHLLGAPPDWERILPERAGRSFHLVVLDDTTGLPLEEAAAFDLGAVARSLPGVLAAEPVDRRVAPLFGFLVVETAAGEHAAVDRLQASDLREFVVPA